MNTPQPGVTTTFVDRLKEQLNTIDSAVAVNLAIYFGVALLAGVIIKKAGRLVLVVLITAVLLFWLLDYFAVATFDLDKIKALFGLDPAATLTSAVQQAMAWAQANPLHAVVIIIGLLFGLSIG